MIKTNMSNKGRNIAKGLIALSLCLVLSGCGTTYYPKGIDKYGALPFFNSYEALKCRRCKQDTYIFKLDKKERVTCSKCYRKLKGL